MEWFSQPVVSKDTFWIELALFVTEFCVEQSLLIIFVIHSVSLTMLEVLSHSASESISGSESTSRTASEGKEQTKGDTSASRVVSSCWGDSPAYWGNPVLENPAVAVLVPENPAGFLLVKVLENPAGSGLVLENPAGSVQALQNPFGSLLVYVLGRFHV